MAQQNLVASLPSNQTIIEEGKWGTVQGTITTTDGKAASYVRLNGKIAYHVNGTYKSAQSFRDVVGSKRFYINLSVLFHLGIRTELLVEGDYLNHQFTPDFGLGSLDNTKIANLPSSRFSGATWQYATTAQATASATVKHQLNDAWSFNAILSYQNYIRDYYSIERIQPDQCLQLLYARKL